MPAILLALTSHDRLGDTGRRTGFYVPEAARPYRAFTAAGHRVDFASVQGGAPPRDGVKAGDEVTEGFLAEVGDRLADTVTFDRLDPAGYDAVMFVGGHGAMWDFPGATDLARFTVALYERGGVVAAVCHGPAALVGLRLSDGAPLVAGKQVSAFTNEEEAAVGLTEVVPFLLETALVGLGARFSGAPKFTEHAVADARLVTGQNPASAQRVAELTLEQLHAGVHS
jgi:putative intracellular protease/amidase